MACPPTGRRCYGVRANRDWSIRWLSDEVLDGWDLEAVLRFRRVE